MIVMPKKAARRQPTSIFDIDSLRIRRAMIVEIIGVVFTTIPIRMRGKYLIEKKVKNRPSTPMEHLKTMLFTCLRSKQSYM